MESVCLYAASEPARPIEDVRPTQLHPEALHACNGNMIVDASALRAALLKLLHAKGLECDEQSIRVSLLARAEPPAFYLVVPAPSCAANLAAEVSRLTGRLLLSHSAAWLLFDHDAELIVRSTQSLE